MHHAPHTGLKNEAGSSVAEFVIIAPLLSLLALAAYDLNKRAEDAQNVVIVARNAAYFGDVGQDGAFARSTALGSLTDYDAGIGRDRGMVGLVEAAERDELAFDPDKTTEEENPTKAGTRIGVTSARSLSSSDLDLMRQPPGLRPVPDTFADGYEIATDALSASLGPVDSVMKTYDSVFSLSGLDPRENMRRSEVEISLSGTRNAIARSIGLLGDMVGKTGTAPMGKHFAGRFHILSQSAYHTNDYRNAALAGAGIGAVFYPKWGSQGGFSATSDKLQSRCMSRLSMEPSCETATTILETDRQFLVLIRALATAKLTLSTVMAVGTLGFGTAAEEALYAALKAAADDFISSMGSNVVQTGQDMIMDYAGDRARQFEDELGQAAVQKMTDFSGDFLPTTDVVKSVVGDKGP